MVVLPYRDRLQVFSKYLQQLRDGIDNFFCIFIELLDSPSSNIFDEKENPKEYLSGFLQGTRSALSSENRQSITITLEKLNCFSLGALIALFESCLLYTSPSPRD